MESEKQQTGENLIEAAKFRLRKIVLDKREKTIGIEKQCTAVT